MLHRLLSTSLFIPNFQILAGLVERILILREPLFGWMGLKEGNPFGTRPDLSGMAQMLLVARLDLIISMQENQITRQTKISLSLDSETVLVLGMTAGTSAVELGM
jgi:hypothetical protein